jgi:hypothetical protein
MTVILLVAMKWEVAGEAPAVEEVAGEVDPRRRNVVAARLYFISFPFLSFRSHMNSESNGE